MRAFDFVFVTRAGSHAGKEYLPDAGAGVQPHRVAAPVPGVEIADHADAPGIRRPDGEIRARYAVHDGRMRAHFLEGAKVASFRVQIEIQLAKDRAERIRIVDRDVGCAASNLQPIRKAPPTLCDGAGKEPCVMCSHQLRDLVAGFATEDADPPGTGVKDPHHELAGDGVLVHAEKRKRVVLVSGQNGPYSMHMSVGRGDRLQLILPSHWRSCLR